MCAHGAAASQTCDEHTEKKANTRFYLNVFCLFSTQCVGIDVALLCVFSHAQRMYYALPVLSGFLSV